MGTHVLKTHVLMEVVLVCENRGPLLQHEGHLAGGSKGVDLLEALSSGWLSELFLAECSL